jgi:inhibitor of cysteine peptidase
MATLLLLALALSLLLGALPAQAQAQDPTPTPVDEATEEATAEAMEEATPEPIADPVVGEEPTPQPLTLDESGKAQATGSLEPQGMAAYVLPIAADAQVQAAVTPADSSLILTVVGADGVPLQTDHVGASNFDQTMPAEQEYTFKVINFGEGAQEYTFDIAVTAAEAAAEEAAMPIKPEPIQLVQGNVLVVPLAGNPSTGYVWQVKPSAEGILTPRGEADFAAPSDAPGAPGYEIFTFDAAGAGDVTLTFTYSRPWDETTPPEQVIDLPFVVAAPPATAEPPAPPQPITIGEAENGGAVDMQTGGALFVELPGNPTTGYIWQITSKDDAFLRPLDYTFEPDSGVIGAGGVERFEFEAVAPGEVVLEFAQSRPWETDAEPAATYSVTVRIAEEAQ